MSDDQDHDEMSEASDDFLLKKLQSDLYRWNCPQPDRLGDYQLQLLAEQENKAIEAHLLTCILCQQELKAAARFLIEEDEKMSPAFQFEREPNWWQTVWHRLVETLTGQVQLEMGHSGIRGDTSKLSRVSFTLDNEPLELLLSVRKQLDAFHLRGQLLTDSLMLETQLHQAVVEIWQSGTPVAITFVDEDLDFSTVLEDLAPVIIRVTTQNNQTLSCRLQLAD